ncbi:MAG TPA: MFS transporter [Methylomirabilota bacterium]|nr:MFS transporter [Methylomirabilota bacterium]
MILAPFRVRSFRYQWPADLLTSWASEMETIILGWYVMVHTGSVVLLTVFGSLQFLGTLLAPMFGVLGDRVGPRLMLCAMRGIYAGLAGVVLLLAATGWLAPGWVLLIAGLNGIVRPNDLVMRNSLIGETIPPAQLMGAVGLSRATMDSARVGGALAGAGLSTFLGLPITYCVVTACYLGGLALTLGVARRRPVGDPTAVLPEALLAARWQELKDGLAHVLSTPRLLAPICLAFLINLTAYPVSGGLLPYVARTIYQVDATGLGWLVASFSLGGLLGSATMVTTGGGRRPERMTLIYTAVWYALLLGFGHLRSIGPALLLLLAAGFVQNVAMISMTATLITGSGDRFRARVMGVRTLAVYGLPLGLMASGALVERIGYPLTITAGAATGLLFTLLIGVKWRTAMWRAGRVVPV